MFIILQPLIPEPIPTVPNNGSVFHTLPHEYDVTESIEEATRRISVKYSALERNVRLVVNGKIPSVIASGPPGLGKSFTVEHALAESNRQRHDSLTPVERGADWYDFISGGCSAPGLYHSFWNMRDGGLVVIDDCDTALFENMEALNLVKKATDSSQERILNWRKRASWLEVYGIPRSFEFRGHLIFLTNIDFEQIIKKHNRDTEHYKALMDRARYICLTIRTQRDFMIRIRTVCAGSGGILQRLHGLTAAESEMILEYIEHNKMRFYNLSIRLVGQIAESYINDREHWQEDIEATKMKTTND